MTRATPLQIEAAADEAPKKRRKFTLPPQNMPTPIPVDFRRHSSDRIPDLEKRYGVGKYVLQRWRRELGIYPRRVKISIQMKEVIRLSEAGLSVNQISNNLGVGRKAVYGAAERYGYVFPKRKPASRAQPLPVDFAEKFHTMSYEALADYYQRAVKTIRAWASRAGLKRVRPAVTPANRLSRARPIERPIYQRSSAAPRLVTHHKAVISEVRRDSTEAGKAQEILQRDKWVVYRCDETGRQTQSGKLWRCGRVIVTDAELIERAGRVTARMGRVGV